MIRHIVMWKLATDDPAQKSAQIDTLRDRFAALVGVIEGTRSLDIVADVDRTDGNWDVALIGDYDDHQALDAYQVHPAHQDVVTYVRSVVSARACIDFEL